MNWKVWLKPLTLILYLIIVCILLPFIIQEFNNKHAITRKEAWLVGCIFVMGAVPISLWTILEHVISYTKPYLQRHIIRILWMVPIYALCAWLALGFRKQAIYFDTLTECYEAYVIYNFMAFLLNFLKHQYPDFGYMVEQKPQVNHLFPCCYCPKWPMGRKYINTCRHGVLQYTLVRPITTIIAFICEMAGVYHMNEFRIDGAYVYLNILNNISQIWAMYSLIMFYRCMKIELKPLKPMSKFLCVKFVVFLSFWQSVLFAILTATKVISSVEAWKLTDPREISVIFQNFFICIEMFIAAIAHHFSFSVDPYRLDNGLGQPKCCYSCLAMCDVSDVKRDMMEHVKHVGNTVKSKLPFSNNNETNLVLRQNEETPLITAGYQSDSDISRYSDTDSRSKGVSGQEKSVPKISTSCQESIDSIGSSAAFAELMTDNPRSTILMKGGLAGDGRSSLNNHLMTSRASAVTLTTLTEGTSESHEPPLAAGSSHELSDLAYRTTNHSVIPNGSNQTFHTA